MRGFKNAVTLLVTGMLACQTCVAQVDPWERVKLIEQGKNVRIKLHSGKTVKGKMGAWTGDGLTVRQGKEKVVPVANSDVAQVALVTGMSRGRKAAYAALITAGVLGGLLGAACASGGCYDEAAGYAIIGAGVWTGIAAGIAALFPPHKEVIYTALPSTPGAGVHRK